MKDITSELRIGNFVTMNGEPLGVDVSDSPVEMDTKLFHAAIHGFKGYWPVGIPLTEEWLVKFGELQWLYKDNTGYYVLIHKKRVYIKFVHSLQNMYFCIYGKDAIFK